MDLAALRMVAACSSPMPVVPMTTGTFFSSAYATILAVPSGMEKSIMRSLAPEKAVLR